MAATRCMCEWESGCGGLGVIHCRGCGGDQCICRCGGERDCEHCEDCDPYLGDDYETEGTP